MKKFDVEITETLQRTVSVEADSRAEAERLVTEAWNNEDYVLDSTDFVGVDFKTVGEQELSENRKMEILLVQPGMYPQKATIGTELKDFQDAVGGTIAASYPFDDKGETTMEFFNSAIEVLQTLVVALGAGLGVWGAINLLEGYGNDNPGSNAHVR